MRSSQTIEEQTSGSSGGVPGALSNEPPGNATAPEQAAGGTGQKETTVPNNSRRKSIKNYELDRTISHTRLGSGRVKRLSVAVVIDDKVAFDDKGEATRTPYSPEELDRFTGLVKEAVGYNAQRGDSVSVINVPFNVPQPAEPIPEPVMWKQSWFQDIIKKVIGGIIVLVLLFGVLQPILKMLAQQAKLGKAGSRQLVAAGGGDSDDVADDTLSLSSQSVPKLSPPSESSNMKVVKAVVEQDPKLAAQVVKNWVSNEN